jgi:hypothetical protein
MTALALSSTLAPSFVSCAQASSPILFPADLSENEESAAIVAETQSGGKPTDASGNALI